MVTRTAKHVFCRVCASFTPILEIEDMSDWEEDDLFLTQNSFSGLLNVHGKLEEMLDFHIPD